MAEDKTKEKQIYLRTEIPEKGYSTDAFIEFLSKKKPDAENLDNWTIEDLKEAVKQFVSETPKPEITESIKVPSVDHSGDEEMDVKKPQVVTNPEGTKDSPQDIIKLDDHEMANLGVTNPGKDDPKVSPADPHDQPLLSDVA